MKHIIKLSCIFMSLIMLVGCTEMTTTATYDPSDIIKIEDTPVQTPNIEPDDLADAAPSNMAVSEYPEYDGQASVIINDNLPFFTADDLQTSAYESYSPLDALGRPGVAIACLGRETMPSDDESRGEIGMIRPAGWHTVKYPDVIPDLYLYNRCHLIGWQLSAENANIENLITGTRYLNVTGMLPYENLVADYIRTTGNHVLYRVTPIYNDTDLLCEGLLMEAQSIETEDVRFCVYCYNIQPGIVIDYATGDSHIENIAEETDEPVTEITYVLNTNSHKIHRPDCKSVQDIKPQNKQTTDENIDVLIQQGYSPCGLCHPEQQ